MSVWTVLAEEEECDLSQAEIAARLGISESTVSEAVTALRLTGWAQCVEDRHSRGRTNRLRALRVPGRRYERGEYRGTGGQPGAHHRDSDHLLQVYRSLGGREGEKDQGSKAATLARKCEEEGLPAEQIIREAFRGRRRPPSMGMILRHRQALAAALRAGTVSQPSQPSVTPSPAPTGRQTVEEFVAMFEATVREVYPDARTPVGPKERRMVASLLGGTYSADELCEMSRLIVYDWQSIRACKVFWPQGGLYPVLGDLCQYAPKLVTYIGKGVIAGNSRSSYYMADLRRRKPDLDHLEGARSRTDEDGADPLASIRGTVRRVFGEGEAEARYKRERGED